MVFFDCYLFIFIFFLEKLRIVIANLGYVVVSLCYTTKLVLIAMLVKQVLFALAAMLDIQVILVLTAM